MSVLKKNIKKKSIRDDFNMFPRVIPDFWDEKYLSETMSRDVLESTIEMCNIDIPYLENLKEICGHRLLELSKLKYKYVIRLFYSPAFNGDYCYEPPFYRVIVLKYPVLNNTRGEPYVKNESNHTSYGSALVEFNTLKKRYKKFNPQLSDEVPDELKHTRGDL